MDYIRSKLKYIFTSGGEPLQILKFNNNTEEFEVDEDNLTKILNHKDSYDLPIAIISLSGPTRVGKSLTLSYIVEYLKKGDLKLSNDPVLSNFKWRGGTLRETIGMYAWSDLIITERSGKKIAVMLIDTQGLFDGETSETNEAKLFALSTMLSTLQVYNVQRALRTDKLKCFMHFVEYGKQIQAKASKKTNVPFQNLYYVVRDWEDETDFPPGIEGGMAYYKREFEEKNDSRPKDQSEMRTAIAKCFKRSSCCLLPHPGKNVSKAKFDGKTKDLDEDFFKCLKEFITDLFNPETLPIKMHEGKVLRALDIPRFVGSIASVLSSKSDDLASVVNKSLEGGIIAEVSTSQIDIYINNMTDFIYGDRSDTTEDLEQEHETLRSQALEALKKTLTKKLGKDTLPDLAQVEKDVSKSLDVVFNNKVKKLWEENLQNKKKQKENFTKRQSFLENKGLVGMREMEREQKELYKLASNRKQSEEMRKKDAEEKKRKEKEQEKKRQEEERQIEKVRQQQEEQRKRIEHERNELQKAQERESELQKQREREEENRRQRVAELEQAELMQREVEREERERRQNQFRLMMEQMELAKRQQEETMKRLEEEKRQLQEAKERERQLQEERERRKREQEQLRQQEEQKREYEIRQEMERRQREEQRQREEEEIRQQRANMHREANQSFFSRTWTTVKGWFGY